MTTQTLSPSALSVIDQYLHFQIGASVCSVPYFNNKTAHQRMALGARIGKGSPKDILDEVQSIIVKDRISANLLEDKTLKKILTDNNIGIDCSGFAYFVLNEASREAGKESIGMHISFVDAHGFFGKIRSKLRPVENCNVATFAHEKNSRLISMKDEAVMPGDIITMTDDSNERDHILIIHEVDSERSRPVKLYYSHAIAYPEDGVYGTGIKQGVIEITDPNKSIAEQRWIENSLEGMANRLFTRAQKSKTELRRLNWL